MKRFSFRLQHVQNLREQEEELWKLKLGQAARKVEELDLSIEKTHEGERQGLREYHNPLHMHAAQLYMLRMKADRVRFQKEREAAEKIRLAILVDYTKARQKAEVLRKVREKQKLEWKHAYLEYEDANMDDMASARRILQTRVTGMV